MNYPDTMYFVCRQSDYASYYVANGNVLVGGLVPVQFAPDGWEKAGIQISRNPKLWGLDRSFTIPLKAVEDFAQIIKYRVYKYGTEDGLILVILRRKMFFSPTEYGIYYDHFYKGAIDLSQVKHQGPVVTFNAMEGGIPRYIKTNENVKYEFKMKDLQHVYVKHTGLRLHSKSTWATITESLTALAQGGSLFRYGWVSAQFVSTDGTTFDTQTNSYIQTTWGSATNNDDNRNLDNWFFSSTSPITITFETNLEVRLINYLTYDLYIKNSNGTRTTLFTRTNPNPFAAIDETVTANISITMNVAAGEKLYLIEKLQDSQVAPAQASSTRSESLMTVSYSSVFKTTYVRYFTLRYLLDLLIEKVTEGKHTAESTLLDNIAAKFGPILGQVLVTCEDALRGFEEAIFKTSLADFFTSVNSLMCIGMGSIRNKLVLETKDHWVDYSTPIVVGNAAPTPSYYPAADYLFHTWKFGYPTVTIEDVNGRYAFNNGQTYTGPNTHGDKVYDAVSVYHADPYLIEYARINFDGKTTTDSSTENAISFAACLPIPAIDTIDGQDATVYELDRRLNQYITTGTHPEPETIFNLPITPKQNLLRHGPFIHSCHYKLSHKYLVLANMDKWRDLEVDHPAQRVVSEKADIEIGSLGAQLFTPWYIDIEVESPVDLIDILDANPVKAVQYVDTTIQLDGLIISCGIEPSTNDAQNYKLLSSPANDLTQLIEVYE